ncbi:hypothetical protein [Streptomyces sp. MST-110588]|uniref:hypothetical protein n=1 Tax=Streptomyces sp. MST-110588 TaxID=2833628 RepID=UPI001F5D8362|nr:hypothetical protein [Streptomyces sp. MST-110588]UNO38798.1 hypothetical protein KGS77_03000 [Streptomyces sp. MST-110588]
MAGRDALPLYGANQSALTAAFTLHGPWEHAPLPLAWWAATSALALLVFHLRTRSYGRPARRSLAAAPETATRSFPPVPG